MSNDTKLIYLPAADPARGRLLRLPADMESHEAFRNITGIIASLEEQTSTIDPEELDDALEANGFERLAFTLGPEIG